MQELSAYQAASSDTPTLGATQGIARQKVESAMNQIRSANQLLNGLATQFPAAAQEVDACKKALVKVGVKIVGSQSQSDSQPTPTGVMG